MGCVELILHDVLDVTHLVLLCRHCFCYLLLDKGGYVVSVNFWANVGIEFLSLYFSSLKFVDSDCYLTLALRLVLGVQELNCHWSPHW